MKLSHAAGYAANALAALTEQPPGAVVTARDLAEGTDAPAGFLARILKDLTGARLLHSLRGPHGGFRLARPARAITLLDIVEAVDGPYRGDVPRMGLKDRARVEGLLEGVMDVATGIERRQLQKVTLADLAGGDGPKGRPRKSRPR